MRKMKIGINCCKLFQKCLLSSHLPNFVRIPCFDLLPWQLNGFNVLAVHSGEPLWPMGLWSYRALCLLLTCLAQQILTNLYLSYYLFNIESIGMCNTLWLFNYMQPLYLNVFENTCIQISLQVELGYLLKSFWLHILDFEVII